MESNLECAICLADALIPLPNPHERRSIASDLRVVDEPLNKFQCQVCGAIGRRGSNAPLDFSSESYDLYAHAPGRVEEQRRQEAYATWLDEALGPQRSCFEAGSGNGSLLLALRERWGDISIRGVEPAPAAAQAARSAGVNVATGTLEANTLGEPAELAFAINVIEHTADPRAFLRALATHGRRVAIVCPDATTPNTEVLFLDHLHSLRPAHIARLFADCGLSVDKAVSAPSALGSFQLTLGSSNALAADGARVVTAHPDGNRDYLSQWQALDAVLFERMAGAQDIVSFGAGEMAGLLRAYAPRTWSRVRNCIVDQPEFDHFGDLPVIPVAAAPPFPILLAVRPSVQARLAERFAANGANVIRWDDQITA